MLYAYLVYKHRGVTRVKKGWFDGRNNFIPAEKGTGTPWHVNNPTRAMTLYNGKVFCYDEEQIPEAIKMVEDNYDRNGKKLKEQCDKRIAKKEQENSEVKGMTIDEAIKLMKDGAHNHYKAPNYYMAYGMAIGALEAVQKLVDFNDDDLYKAFKEKEKDEKDLLFKLIMGEISASEYDSKLRELKKEKEDKNIYEYDVRLTEAEFNAVLRALQKVEWQNSKMLEPSYRERWRKDMTIDDLARIRIELATVRSLIANMMEAQK